jgi:crossover junction endodeoxyribonuclease RuvC
MSVPRLLGIDPGLRVTGFGVIEIHGKELRYVASGCIKSNDKLSLPARIKTLFAGLSEVIATYQPNQAALEKVFVNVNPQSTLLLGQARGAALSALVHADLPVAEYTALQIKQAVVGQGKAAKEQVQAMVIRLLKLPGAPTADAADALACAICHAHGGQGLGALSTAGYRIRGGRLIG